MAERGDVGYSHCPAFLFELLKESSSPYINRFLQPDTIVPSPASPKSFNRYSYVLNNPMKLTDPSGHKCVGEPDECLNNKGKPINGTGGLSNKKKVRRQQAPRSTLIPDFEFFSDVPWFTDVVPIDSAQMQQFCARNYGIDVECGRFPTTEGAIELNFRIDAIGIRIEGSGWLLGGSDLNVDLLYFGRSDEAGLFVSPGGQMGSGGGSAITGGILIGENMPGRGSYSGASYTVAGVDVPVVPLGVNLEGDYSVGSPNPDGTIPSTTYVGVGPLQPEAGSYSGASYTVPITGFWDWITGR